MTDNPQDNPQQSTEDLRTQLLAEVYANDKAEEGLTPETSGAQSDEARMTDDGAREPKSDTETDTKPPNPEPSAEAKERARDEHGKFVKQEATEPTPAEQAPEPKQESNYAKKFKEEQRRDKSWQALEAEKQSFRQEREQILSEIKALRQDVVSSGAQRPATARFASAQYNQAADEFAKRGRQFYKDGDVEQGDAQFDLASQARAQAGEAQKAEFTEAQGKFDTQWRDNANAVIKEVPELGDPNSEMSKDMIKLLEQHPVLGLVNDGFKHAHEILTLRRQAAEVSGLREENKTLKQEVDRLTKLTTPLGGKDTAKHSAPSNIADLPLEQQKATLFRQVEMADAA